MKRTFFFIYVTAMTLAGCESFQTMDDELIENKKEIDATTVDFSYTINDRTVSFTNLSESKVQTFVWSLGDNTTAQTINATHTYDKDGTYEVILAGYWAFKGRTVKKYCEKKISVKETPASEVKGYFEYEMSGYNAVNIQDMSIGVRAVYDFGDGETKEIELPYNYLIWHHYDNEGTYKLSVTAYNEKGELNKYERTITIQKPQVYITGIEYCAIDFEGRYYRAKLVDDDIFTTTWFNTNYSPILYDSDLPYTYIFTNPVLMDGLSEDDYYTLYVYYNTTSSGTGTQCLKQNVYKAVITAYLPYIEVKNNSEHTIVRLLMEYK